jgi:hypothetical protein
MSARFGEVTAGVGAIDRERAVNKTVFAASYMTSYTPIILQLRLLILLEKFVSFRSTVSLTERQ